MRAPLALFAVLLAAGIAGRAEASPVTYRLSYLPAGEVASLGHGYENLTIHDPTARFSEAGAAGPLTLDVHSLTPGGGTTPLELLCTDVFDTYVSPGTYTLGRLSDTLHDAVKVGQIEALIQHGLPGVTDNASASALQVAVWEVENETGDSGYSVTGGKFYVSGYAGALDPRMVSDASADLAKVLSGAWRSDPGKVVMQFEPFGRARNQSFAYIAPAPVPEPACVTLFGLGTLTAIWVGWRRRTGAVQTA